MSMKYQYRETLESLINKLEKIQVEIKKKDKQASEPFGQWIYINGYDQSGFKRGSRYGLLKKIREFRKSDSQKGLNVFEVEDLEKVKEKINSLDSLKNQWLQEEMPPNFGDKKFYVYFFYHLKILFLKLL